MNDDLISREALKEEIEKYLEKRQDVIVWESDIYNIIDNAPTVNSGSWSKGYHEGFQVGSELGKTFSRPQGEWKLIQGSSVVFGCSCCNIRIIAMIPYNFCPNCGAEMRGEEE